MKSLLLSIVLFFVSSFSFAQQPTGITKKVSNDVKELLFSKTGKNVYYINRNGNETHLSKQQAELLGVDFSKFTAATKATNLPTADVSQKISNGNEEIGKDSKGRTLYKGSRGGIYYINSNGNKTYVQKDN